jgi:hypothetical protein
MAYDTQDKAMDIFKDYLGIILPLIAAVAWLVRLEARSLSNQREIEKLWLQRKEDLESAKEARDATNEMLKEMRADIKAILLGVAKK